MFGAGFGELNGKEFVYKSSSFTRLMDITERLKKQFATRGDVELLANTLSARDAVSDDKLWLQVVAVEPHFEPNELSERPRCDIWKFGVF